MLCSNVLTSSIYIQLVLYSEIQDCPGALQGPTRWHLSSAQPPSAHSLLLPAVAYSLDCSVCLAMYYSNTGILLLCQYPRCCVLAWHAASLNHLSGSALLPNSLFDLSVCACSQCIHVCKCKGPGMQCSNASALPKASLSVSALAILL